MKQKYLTVNLTNEERETLLTISGDGTEWLMDSTITKDYNRALKQGWKPLSEQIDTNGKITGMTLTAPRRAVTIGMAELPKRKPMTEQQRANLFRRKNSVSLPQKTRE